MKWITRKEIKVDRVACPWLIKRFVDPQAEFLFVEERELLEQAKLHDAIPFDAPKIEARSAVFRLDPVRFLPMMMVKDLTSNRLSLSPLSVRFGLRRG